jgi:hypothetical protein
VKTFFFFLLPLILNGQLAQQWPGAGAGKCGYPLEWTLGFFFQTSSLGKSKSTKLWKEKVLQAISSLNSS